MAFAVADRVKETSTTTGTGTLSLGGAEPGYQTFVAGIGNANTTYYAIVNRATSEFEVGIGTVTDAATDTLSRDTVISSSNANALVNFSAGTKDVICTLPSEKSYVLNDAGDTTISADLSVTSISGSGAGLTGLNASNLASGTLPDARFPATLPASSGANLTNLNGSNVSSGTIADARLTANVTLNNASTISAGTLADARLTANVTLNNASTISTGTLPNARLSAVPNSALENSSITINGSGVSLGGSINVGDITGVTAGSGLTGGGTSGDVTLNVGAGTGVTVAADTVSIGQAVETTSSPTFATLNLNNTGGSGYGSIEMGGANGAFIDMKAPFSDDYDARIQYQSSDGFMKLVGQTGVAIKLGYGNSIKLETTATGVEVSGTLVETSSIDYKENVQPLDFNDAIYSVNAVKYDRKDGSAKDEVGVIAEELYKVLPDLVECKDGKPEAVKYTKMTMYLLEALKKQNQEIQELKQRLK